MVITKPERGTDPATRDAAVVRASHKATRCAASLCLYTLIYLVQFRSSVVPANDLFFGSDLKVMAILLQRSYAMNVPCRTFHTCFLSSPCRGTKCSYPCHLHRMELKKNFFQNNKKNNGPAKLFPMSRVLSFFMDPRSTPTTRFTLWVLLTRLKWSTTLRSTRGWTVT